MMRPCRKPDAATVGERSPRASRKSSIFLRRIVGVMFMRVNSKRAHQVRPPGAPTIGRTPRRLGCVLWAAAATSDRRAWPSSYCWKPETLARVRRQCGDAGRVRPPMFLCPRRTGWTAATGNELLEFARHHAEALRRPCRFIATAAQLHLEPKLPGRVEDGQLIQHPVRGALQTIRLP